MHAFLHIIYRKVIASLLLALFIFIHAEKVFHTHQKIADCSQQKGLAVISISANCPICDFQLAKDSELPSLINTNIPFTYWAKEYTISSSFYNYLPATQISNRGPPVI